MAVKFKHHTFGERLGTMLKVDFRRMFTMPLLYIMIGVAFVIPILVLVMTTSLGGTQSGMGTSHSGMNSHHSNVTSISSDFGGSHSIDSVSGTEMTMEPFTNTWQAIGSASGEGSGMSMDMTSMCNINLLYFAAAVLVCIFVSDDFRSGYAKNLFTVRAKKTDYVVSKTLVNWVGSVLMIAAFFVGTVIGGGIAGLSFDLGTAGVSGLVMCMLAKCALMGVFIPIFLMWSTIAKQKLWMSLVGSLMTGMLLFMMIPMLTPLDSTIVNVLMCLIGGALFSFGLGAVSNKVLNSTSLV